MMDSSTEITHFPSIFEQTFEKRLCIEFSSPNSIIEGFNIFLNSGISNIPHVVIHKKFYISVEPFLKVVFR